jgi:hypothetical protein
MHTLEKTAVRQKLQYWFQTQVMVPVTFQSSVQLKGVLLMNLNMKCDISLPKDSIIGQRQNRVCIWHTSNRTM